ncbi:hypothetical protein K7432_011599 [Basidiobolus ranarum]|uniref:Uncharacterized protein n=1 Tax=Basidiobolus ranarum TaxID=34480 RepID=A0ABR2WLZ2_9FUNG
MVVSKQIGVRGLGVAGTGGLSDKWSKGWNSTNDMELDLVPNLRFTREGQQTIIQLGKAVHGQWSTAALCGSRYNDDTRGADYYLTCDEFEYKIDVVAWADKNSSRLTNPDVNVHNLCHHQLPVAYSLGYLESEGDVGIPQPPDYDSCSDKYQIYLDTLHVVEQPATLEELTVLSQHLSSIFFDGQPLYFEYLATRPALSSWALILSLILILSAMIFLITKVLVLPGVWRASFCATLRSATLLNIEETRKLDEVYYPISLSRSSHEAKQYLVLNGLVVTGSTNASRADKPIIQGDINH